MLLLLFMIVPITVPISSCTSPGSPLSSTKYYIAGTCAVLIMSVKSAVPWNFTTVLLSPTPLALSTTTSRTLSEGTFCSCFTDASIELPTRLRRSKRSTKRRRISESKPKRNQFNSQFYTHCDK